MVGTVGQGPWCILADQDEWSNPSTWELWWLKNHLPGSYGGWETTTSLFLMEEWEGYVMNAIVWFFCDANKDIIISK